MTFNQTKIKSGKLGEPYYTYRIVESIREGKKVKQVTLLNLGKHFEIEKEHWPALISRGNNRTGTSGNNRTGTK